MCEGTEVGPGTCSYCRALTEPIMELLGKHKKAPADPDIITVAFHRSKKRLRLLAARPLAYWATGRSPRIMHSVSPHNLHNRKMPTLVHTNNETLHNRILMYDLRPSTTLFLNLIKGYRA